jgi:GT2 family glycosyltransferase
MPDLPSVTVVIPNWNGAAHLPDCLDALAALDYPSGRLTVIVVDNGSTDASRKLLTQRYPRVQLVGLSRNEGFAAACNAGARAAQSECVAFINNDMRADTAWLHRLIDAYDPDAGFVCVGGVILDWDGSHVDFVEGSVNFQGFAWQQHLNEPFDERLVTGAAPLLFACGGSMLISREVYLELGGFDDSYFAYYEDVDLGWRLWLAGYKVRLAADARVFHRHHGSAAALPKHLPSFLYERNALLTLFKNLSDENLSRVLAPGLLLLVEKVALLSGSEGDPRDAETTDVPRAALIPLDAVANVVGQLPKLLERRRHVQDLRRRSDDEIFDLFFRPFTPWMHDNRYLEASVHLREAFGLDRLFRRQRAITVLVVGADSDVSEQLALANVLLHWSQENGNELADLVAEADIVVAPADTQHADTISAETQGLLVVDGRDSRAAGSSALLDRADVVLGSSDLTVLKEIVREPWRWRREGTANGIAVPEDLQWLLRMRRIRREPAAVPASPRLTTGIRRIGGRILRHIGMRA